MGIKGRVSWGDRGGTASGVVHVQWVCARVCVLSTGAIYSPCILKKERKKSNVIWKGLRFNCDNVNCDFSLACSYLLKLINANAETEVSWFILLRCGRVWGHDGRCICILCPSVCLSVAVIDVESTWKRTIPMFMVYVWFCDSHILCVRLWNRYWHLYGCAYC